MSELRPGVLALQGSVEPHVQALWRLGHDAVPVRTVEQLQQVSHLVLPGGESTTLYKLLDMYGLWAVLDKRGRSGDLALFGTCAGAILLGRTSDVRPPRLNLIDVTVERNAYGSQIDSFIAPVKTSLGSVDGVFIRAPKFHDPGPDVVVEATLNDEPVMVRQGRILAATFHPELTEECRLHEQFLAM